MSEMTRGLSRGCLRASVIRVIAVIIVIPLWCALIFVPLTVVTRNPDASIWWLIVPAVLFLLVTVGGGCAVAAWVIWRRIRQLDAAFTPLGLTGQMYHLLHRQYHGILAGRQVGAYFTRGPLLELEAGTSLQTRFGMSRDDVDTAFFARLFNRQPMSLTDPVLDDLLVFPLDEDWMRALLAVPEAQDLLRRLVSFDGAFVRRHVLLRPGALTLQLYGSRRLLEFKANVEPDQVRQWFDDLLALASIAESLREPQQTSEETSVERLARSMRKPSATLWIAAAVVVGVVLCPTAIVAVVIALYLVLGQ
jgi:hypothetical protein